MLTDTRSVLATIGRMPKLAAASNSRFSGKPVMKETSSFLRTSAIRSAPLMMSHSPGHCRGRLGEFPLHNRRQAIHDRFEHEFAFLLRCGRWRAQATCLRSVAGIKRKHVIGRIIDRCVRGGL